MNKICCVSLCETCHGGYLERYSLMMNRVRRKRIVTGSIFKLYQDSSMAHRQNVPYSARRRKQAPYQGAPNFPVVDMWVGPYKIPLDGKNRAPQLDYNPWRNPLLFQEALLKNDAVYVALHNQDPQNSFYESLRSWYTFFSVQHGTKRFLIQFTHPVHTYRIAIHYDNIERMALRDENGTRIIGLHI